MKSEINYCKIINLKSQKGKILNGQICQILESDFSLDNHRLNVRLMDKNDTTIYKIKLENLQYMNNSNRKQLIYSNSEQQKKAKEFLFKNKIDIPDIDQNLLQSWFRETHLKKCYIENQAIAFLTKNDFDRQKKHKEPWMIDYIYTIPKKRRKGNALKILKQIKQQKETSAICSSQQSIKLFKKAGFHKGQCQLMLETMAVMRFP